MPALPDALPHYMRQCKRHSVFYNCEKYNACAVCRASGDEPRLIFTSVVLGVAGILLIGSGIYLAFAPTLFALSAEPAAQAVDSTASIRLNPTLVQPQLIAVENLIFSDSLSSHRGELAAAMAALTQAVGVLQGPPRPVVGRFFGDMTGFTAVVDSIAGTDTSRDNVNLANQWIAVRDRVFAPAPWLHLPSSSTSPDLRQ